MLEIRLDQLDTFSNEALRAFARNLNKRIQTEGPTAETARAPDEQLAEVYRLIEEAERYEISIDDDVIAFVVTQMSHGTRLTPPSEAYIEVCTDRTLATQEKIDKILEEFLQDQDIG